MLLVLGILSLILGLFFLWVGVPASNPLQVIIGILLLIAGIILLVRINGNEDVLETLWLRQIQ